MLTTVPRDYSLIAPIYDHVFNKILSDGHKKLGVLLKKKKAKSGFKVLEVGVGSGLSFEYLPGNIEFQGIDISSEMLALAQEKAQKMKRRKISLGVMDAHKLSYEANTFDLVMAASVISAVQDPVKVMREMIKVTKKGGEIAIIANIRENTYASQIVKRFDPWTKRILGFRTDMDCTLFEGFKELELIEKTRVNNFLGFPLSTFLLYRKK